MRTREVTFIIKFEEPQDVEVDCNNLNDVYLALDALLQIGIIADYNCSEMKPEGESCIICEDYGCTKCGNAHSATKCPEES